jgi:hypothetical protein
LRRSFRELGGFPTLSIAEERPFHQHHFANSKPLASLPSQNSSCFLGTEEIAPATANVIGWALANRVLFQFI